MICKTFERSCLTYVERQNNNTPIQYTSTPMEIRTVVLPCKDDIKNIEREQILSV